MFKFNHRFREKVMTAKQLDKIHQIIEKQCIFCSPFIQNCKEKSAPFITHIRAHTHLKIVLFYFPKIEDKIKKDTFIRHKSCIFILPCNSIQYITRS